jgi:adenylate cyclase
MNKNKFESIIVLILGVGTALLLATTPLADNFNLYVYDFLLANTKANSIVDDVVVIGIDDKALERFDDPLVLWHKYLSKIIDGLADSGAKGIALDIIPSISLEKLAPELDRQLIRSIRMAQKKGTPVYLGFRAGKYKVVPHRKFLFAATGLGFLNLYPDKDGKIRKQTTLLTGENSRVAYSLPLLTIKQNDPSYSEQSQRQLYIDYRLAPPPILAFGQVYDWVQAGNNDKLGPAFNNKIVFIGATSHTLPDIYAVPINKGSEQSDRVPGVLIHALTAKTLLANKLIKDIPEKLVWILAIVVALASGILFLLLSPRKAGAIVSVLFLIMAGGTIYAFNLFWTMPVAPFILGFIIPGAVTGTYRYSEEYRQFRYLQRFFKSYVNPQVMQEIIDNPEMVSFDGQQVVVTVMFTDIRNFTTMSENMEPSVLVAGLNRYFSEMTAAVTEVHGYLNSYLGDGILAVFGSPNELPDDGAWAAVRCGSNMLKRLEELNRSEIFPGVTEKVQIGIGIHTGEAVVGNIGCYEKMDYSIIGDTANLASRIEGVTKEFKTPLLVSETTYNYVKDRVEARFVDSVQVKGREQEVKVYEILSIKKGE